MGRMGGCDGCASGVTWSPGCARQTPQMAHENNSWPRVATWSAHLSEEKSP